MNSSESLSRRQLLGLSAGLGLTALGLTACTPGGSERVQDPQPSETLSATQEYTREYDQTYESLQTEQKDMARTVLEFLRGGKDHQVRFMPKLRERRDVYSNLLSNHPDEERKLPGGQVAINGIWGGETQKGDDTYVRFGAMYNAENWENDTHLQIWHRAMAGDESLELIQQRSDANQHMSLDDYTRILDDDQTVMTTKVFDKDRTRGMITSADIESAKTAEEVRTLAKRYRDLAGEAFRTIDMPAFI